MARSMRQTYTRLNESGGLNYYLSYGTPNARVTACLRYGKNVPIHCSLYLQVGETTTELDDTDLNLLFEIQQDGNILAPQIWSILLDSYRKEVQGRG